MGQYLFRLFPLKCSVPLDPITPLIGTRAASQKFCSYEWRDDGDRVKATSVQIFISPDLQHGQIIMRLGIPPLPLS